MRGVKKVLCKAVTQIPEGHWIFRQNYLDFSGHKRGCASSRLDHSLTTRAPGTEWELDINSWVPCWGTVRGVKKVPCQAVTPISEGHWIFRQNYLDFSGLQGGCANSRLDHGLATRASDKTVGQRLWTLQLGAEPPIRKLWTPCGKYGSFPARGRPEEGQRYDSCRKRIPKDQKQQKLCPLRLFSHLQ